MKPAIKVINPRDFPSASSRCQAREKITPPTSATTPPDLRQPVAGKIYK